MVKDSNSVNRPLTEEENRLALWMLENGNPQALAFTAQLELTEVTPWKCACGCASINFQIKGQPETPPGVHILGDFLLGDANHLSGAFIFESGGLLGGIEVYGLAGDAPTVLPVAGDLRTMDSRA